MWRRFLCFIGWHPWVQTRIVTVNDIFSGVYEPYMPPKRSCPHCHKRQRWLPGYGGSELGCWIRNDEPVKEEESK